MSTGDTVMVPVNGGRLTEGEVIGIYGDTIVVSGTNERRIAKEQGRDPIGVGFNRSVVVVPEKAKTT